MSTQEESYVRAAEFDDIIANAMNGSNGNIQIVDDGRRQAGHPDDDDEGRADVDDIERGGGGDDGSSDGDEEDDDSLSASEISGESDISAMEKEEEGRHHPYYDEEEEKHNQYYSAPPLVNDDESTIDMRPPAPHNQSVSSYVSQLNRQQRSKSRLIKIGVVGMLVAVTVGVILAVITLTKEPESSNTATADKPPTPRDNNVLDFVAITTSPSAKPTEPVVPVVPLNTNHAIELSFEDVPDDYSPSEEDRGSIMGYLKELLSQDLEKNDFELVDVAYAYDRRRSPSTDFRSHVNRRLRSVTIPIVFTVRGPSNANEMLVRSLLIETIESRKRNIVAYLRQYDWETFQSVSLVAAPFVLEDLTPPPSFSPSMRPQTLTPSESPSQHPQDPPTWTPSSSPVEKPEKVVEEYEGDSGTFLPPKPSQESPIKDDGDGEDESEVDNEGDETSIEEQVATLKPSKNPTPAPTEKKTKKPTKDPTQNPTTAKPSRGEEIRSFSLTSFIPHQFNNLPLPHLSAEPTPGPTFRPTPFPISTPRPTVRATPRPTPRRKFIPTMLLMMT